MLGRAFWSETTRLVAAGMALSGGSLLAQVPAIDLGGSTTSVAASGVPYIAQRNNGFATWTVQVPNGNGGYAVFTDVPSTGTGDVDITALNTLIASIGTNSILLGNSSTSATGSNSIAIGANSEAKGANSFAGAGAKTWGGNDVAIGNGSSTGTSTTTTTGNVAIGSVATATGGNALALGTQSTAAGNGVALGVYARATAERSTALGYANVASSLDNVAVGTRNTADGVGALFGTGAVAMGIDNAASNESAVALGTLNTAIGYSSSAVGTANEASGREATAVGNGNFASGERSVAMGVGSFTFSFPVYNYAAGEESVALGVMNYAPGDRSLVVGRTSTSVANDSIAIGNTAATTAAAVNGIALGTNTNATVADGVALGSSSVAGTAAGLAGYNPTTGLASTDTSATWKSTLGAVSVGNGTTATRQITGVAAGTGATDAVNVAQLQSAQAAATTHYFSVRSTNDGTGSNYLNNGASGADSIAIGNRAATSSASSGSVAMGLSAQTLGALAISIGQESQSRSNGVSLGYQAAVGQTSSSFNNIDIGSGAGSTTGADTGAAALVLNALGFSTTVNGFNNLAFGTNSGVGVNGNYNVALGALAGRYVVGEYNISTGRDAGKLVKGSDNLSEGRGAGSWVSGSGNISFGRWTASATGLPSSYLVGLPYLISGSNNLAQGNYAGIGVQGDGNIALGYQAGGGGGATDTGSGYSPNGRLIGSNNVAIGTAAGSGTGNTTASSTVAIGNNATVKANNAVAIGNGAQASGTNSISIGTGNKVNGNNSGAIGDPSIINGANSYSVGNSNTIGSTTSDAFALGNNVYLGADAAGVDTTSVSGAVALGSNTSVTLANSVALGAGSIASATTPTTNWTTTGGVVAGKTFTVNQAPTNGVVAIGNRQIQGVADGEVSATSTNAINGSQLFKTVQAATTHYYSVNDGATQGTNFDNEGATGVNAIASGVNASATGDNSIAMGTAAGARTAGDIVLGNNAKSVSAFFGPQANVVIGNNANTTGFQGDSVVIGNNASDTTTLGKSVVIGSGATAAGGYAAQTVIGAGAISTSGFGGALALNGTLNGTNLAGGALAIQGTASGQGAAAVGFQSTSSGWFSWAQGTFANAIGSTSTAIGVGASSIGQGSIALGGNGDPTNTLNGAGSGARASGVNSVAVGTKAQSVQDGAIAIGPNAVANASTGDVALGSGSVTAAVHNAGPYVITGSATTAAGTTSTSVVSVGTGVAGGERQIQNMGAGVLSATSTDGVNGSQLYATNQAITTLAATPITFTGNTGTVDRKLGETLNISGAATTAGTYSGANVSTEVTGNTVNVKIADAPVFTSVTTGSTAMSTTGVVISGGPSLTTTGIDAANLKVINVADGTIATGSKDAVNGGQLAAVSAVADNAVQYDNAGKTSVTLGGVGALTPTVLTNVAPAALSATSTDAVNGSQLFTTNANVTALAATPITFTGNTGTVDRKLGDTLAISGAATTAGTYSGANVSTEVTGNTVNVKIADAPVFTSVTTGNTVTNTTGVTINDGMNTTALSSTGLVITGGPSVTTTGINAGNQKIINVTAGTAATDAVNVSQLQAATTHDYSVNSTTPGSDTNYLNGGAQGANSLAAGVNASTAVGATNATAIGTNATANGINSFAAGSGASAGQIWDVAVGANATANSAAQVGAVAIGGANPGAPVGVPNTNIASRGSVAVGFGSNANPTTGDAQGGVAIGTYASANDGAYNIAVGYRAQANPTTPVGADGSYAMALGAFSKANAAGSVAAGLGATANNVGDVALGSGSVTAAPHTAGPYVIAGSATNAAGIPTATNSVVSVGTGVAGGERQIQNVGSGVLSAASTDAVNGSQLFATNAAITATASNPITFTGNTGTVDRKLGETLNISGAASTLGTYSGANVSTEVVGNTVNVKIAENPVFTTLTTGNTAMSTTGVVITGGPSMTTTGIDAGSLKILNVADGTIAAGSKDAVNGGQLATVAAVADNAVQYDNAGKTSVTLGGVSALTPTVLTNVAPAVLSATSTDAVNGSQLFTTNANVTALAATPITFTGNIGTVDRKLGDTLAISGAATTAGTYSGANVSTEVTGNTVNVKIADAPVFTSVTTGSTAMSTAGVVITGGPSLTTTGVDAANLKVINVADGTIAAGSKDAINGGQLATVAAIADNAVQYDNAGKTSVTLGGVGALTPTVLTNVAPAVLSATSTDAVNGSQLFTTNANVATNTTNIATNAANITALANTPITFTGNSGTVDRKLGETLNISGAATTTGTYSGANVQTEVTGNTVNVQIADAPKFGTVVINDSGSGKITGVTDGTIATGSKDAVNGGQLAAVSAVADNAVQYDGPTKTSVTLGGVGALTPTVLTNVAPAVLSATSTDAVNGSQLFTTNANVATNTTNIATNAANITALANTPITFTGNTGTVDRKLGETLAISGAATTAGTYSGANVQTEVVGNTVNVKIADAPVFTTVTTGNTAMSTTGVVITGGPSLTTTGIDAANLKVINVADGTIAAGSKDAINGGQLAAVSAIADNAVQYDNAGKTSVTLGGVGALTPTVLTNVAPAVLSATSTDGVNGSQLFTTNLNLTNLGAIVTTQGNTLATTFGGTSAYNPTTGTITGGFTFNNSPYSSVQQVFDQINSSVNDGRGIKYFRANSTLDDSVALGQDSIAIGPISSSMSTGDRSFVAGIEAEAGGSSTVAIGDQAKAQTADSIAIGNQATANGGKSVAIGYQMTATGDGAVAIGDPSTVIGTGAVGIGASNNAYGDGSVAAGENNTVNSVGTPANGTIAIGSGNSAAGQGAVALGNNNTAAGAGAVAIGDNSQALYDGSIALGANSTTGGSLAALQAQAAYNPGTGTIQGATPVGEVSLGSSGAVRRLTHVAAGSADTDAVNISQLKAVATTGANANDTAVKYTWTDTDSDGVVDPGEVNYNQVVMAGDATGTVIMNVAPGTLSATSKEAVNGSQLYTTNQNVTNLTSTVTTLDSLAVKYDSVAQNSVTLGGAAHAPVVLTNVATGTNPTDAVNFAQLTSTISSGVAVRYFVQNETGLVASQAYAVGTGSLAAGYKAGQGGAAANTYNTAVGATSGQNVTGSNNVALGVNAGNSVTADNTVSIGSGATAQAANSVAIGAGSIATEANTVSVGAVGSERRITNVAAGVNATDAVNISQLTGVTGNITNLTNQVTNIDGRVTAIDGRVTNLGNSTATNLGGGSTYNTTTGTVSAPSYTVQGNNYDNVGSAVTAIDGRITYLDGRQNTQQSTLDDHSTRIKQIETWQGATNTRLRELQNGIDATGAMAAALTQVQPKLSEKMRNQLSAGIGFYRDSTAVALGYSHIAATGDKAATVSISVSDRGDLMGGGGMTIGW